MKSAGFGAPGNEELTDQPWGHSRVRKNWSPLFLDNAESLGPAGTVHCSLSDWSKYLAQQLAPASSKLLRRQSLMELREAKNEYAAGWIVVKRDWAKGLALSHQGSNNLWHCAVWVAPELDRAYMVATNSHDERSEVICDKVVSQMLSLEE
jgi:D-alanyl-D-alanine carboxypeptidase